MLVRQPMRTLPSAADTAAAPRRFGARLEPFDSYWQGTRNLEQGFCQFEAYYRANYLPRLPKDPGTWIAVLSCGPGYLVNALVRAGYRHVIGVDADPAKIAHAKARGLPCEVASAFNFLAAQPHRPAFSLSGPSRASSSARSRSG